MSKDGALWLVGYFLLAWSGHICQGLAIGILGPTQPYLARIVGVARDSINLIWTGRGLGSCVATILTGMIFKRFITIPGYKLCFLAASVFISGVSIGLVPFISTFGFLLVGKNNIFLKNAKQCPIISKFDSNQLDVDCMTFKNL